MPHLIGGPEKTLSTDMVIAAHAYSMGATMPILVLMLKISQVSNHKISITLPNITSDVSGAPR